MKYLLFVFSVAALVACKRNNLPKVEIVSSLGNIVVEIDTIHAPVTAGNFLHLIDLGIYENSSFYRVVRLDNQPQSPVKIEVIQGG